MRKNTMNRFLEVLRKSLDIPLQYTLNKTADQIPAGFLILAAVAVDLLVDSKASVELEVENGFCLFRCQIQLLHQSGHIFIL